MMRLPPYSKTGYIAYKQSDDNLTQEQFPVMAESLHLMLIDDEIGVLRAFELLLSSLGYTLTTFSDPRKAVTYLKELEEKEIQVDAIISDLRMPHIDGLQVLEFRNAHCQHIPFVLISGHAKVNEQEKALSLGAQAVLMKPFSADELRSLLEEVCLKNPTNTQKKVVG